VILLLLVFLVGCTGTISTPATTNITTPIINFSPDSLSEQGTRKSLARWLAASGIGLGISEVGIPITTQDDWVYVEGKSNCGNMDFTNREIVVTMKRYKCSYFSFDSLILHELGHAVAGVGGHSKTGIMTEGGKAENRECIDSASLELVCRSADCEVFEPEPCY